MLLGLLQASPLAFAVLVVVLLHSLALHELGHAWVADKMGDKTARNLGRVTLNPIKHLDPFGTLLLLVVGFGWAKPVPIRPDRFRNYRLGMFLVSIAGVVVNLIIALLSLAALAAAGVTLNTLGEVFPRADGSLSAPLLYGLFLSARINIILVVFNLLPIPPLDGSKVLQAFAPASWQRALWGVERYGFFAVILVIFVFDEPVFRLIDGVTFFLMRLVLPV